MGISFPGKLTASILVTFCAAASAQNLVQNPGFATDLSGWSVSNDENSIASWSNADSDGSATSGSVLITDTSATAGSLDTPIEQCLSVLGGASYVLSTRFFFPSGQAASGLAETEILWVSSASTESCSGGYISGNDVNASSTTEPSDTWIPVSKNVVAPPGAVRVMLRVGVDRQEETGMLSANFDDVSFAPAPGPAGVLAGYIAGAGSVHGGADSNFKTGLQATNPGASAIDVRLVYHPAGSPGSAGDPQITTHILPGQTVSAADIVAAVGQSGLGSIDVYSTEGETPPVLIARVFNDAGEDGTTGFTEELVEPGHVMGGPGISVTGVLIGPADTSRFRYNVGIRTLDDPVSVSVSVKDADGSVVHTFSASYPPNEFVQSSSRDFLGDFDLESNQTLVITFSGGKAILYGATVDNVTNDPSVQFMPYLFAIA
jgi:hypothetical protein